jgi:hypothetical protein
MHHLLLKAFVAANFVNISNVVVATIVITNLKLGQNAIENWATDDRQS